MSQRNGGRGDRGRPPVTDRQPGGADKRRPESSRGPRPTDDRPGSGAEEGEVEAAPAQREPESRRVQDRDRGREGRGGAREEGAGASGSSGPAGRPTPAQPHKLELKRASAIAKEKMAAMERQDRQADGDASPSRQQAVGSKRRHDAIKWTPPKRQAVDAVDDSSRPARRPPSPRMTLLERAEKEAEELRRHLEESGMEGEVVMAASPSFSGSEQEEGMLVDTQAGGAEAGGGAQQGVSPDSARANGSGGAGGGAARSRWLDMEEEEQGAPAAAATAARPTSRGPTAAEAVEGDGDGEAGAPAPRSRWHVEEEEEEQEGAAAAARRLGARRSEAASPAEDEDMEELNRRERAELAAAGPSDSDATPAAAYEGMDGYANGGTPQRLGGLSPYGGVQLPAVDMLRECRSVDEYEKLNRISEGTYGVVFRAREKKTGRIYALKKIKLDKDVHGFPQTSIREINVLLSVHHPNIVNVTEVVVGSGYNNVFMVMEYVDADLRNLLDNELKKQPFSTAQVKCLMKQLLQGVAYLHDQWVLHRDLKTSNLLYSNTGQLKICDFGLARQYGSPLKCYTSMVVTLWYRSIELLLGDQKYSTALDMWSVGCIMAELLAGTALFQGKGEIDQINKIFSIMGTPKDDEWPGWQKLSKTLTFKPTPRTLRQHFPKMALSGGPTLSDAGYDLLCGLLELNPQRRLSASEALQHRWFTESPLPAKQELMPAFRTSGVPQ